MAFCDYGNIVAAYDSRLIAGLCSDTAVVLQGPNAVIDEMAAQARGIILGFVRKGDHYTSANMAALEAAKDPLLVRIAVDLTVEFLYTRRGRELPDAVAKQVKKSYLLLDALAKGAAIFSEVTAAPDAGNAVSTVPGPDFAQVQACDGFNTADLPIFGRLRGCGPHGCGCGDGLGIQ